MDKMWCFWLLLLFSEWG